MINKTPEELIKENGIHRKEWWEVVCKYEKEIDESEILTEIVTVGNALMVSSFRVCQSINKKV